MRPSKFHNCEVTKGVIHGPQSHLSISKDAHKINKSSSFPPFSSHQQVIENSRATKQPVRRHPQPVIIYTHSPKVIHAKAHDFMALVQKLTGLQRSEEEKAVKSESDSTKEESSLSEEKDCKNIVYEDTTSPLSVLKDEKLFGEIKQESRPVTPPFNMPSYFGDSAMYAPEWLPNSFYQSAGMDNSLSFSNMNTMKGSSKI